MILRIVLIALAVILVAAVVGAFVITREGKLVTPKGQGTVAIGTKAFEAFPLPDYAARFATDDYKS